GADDLAVRLQERAVGLVLEGDLAHGPHRRRVDAAGQHQQGHGDLEGSEQLPPQHQCTPSATSSMSTSLMPMNGAMMPPTPKISSCLPRAATSNGFVGSESRSTMLPASLAAWVPVFRATPTSA